MDNYTSLKPKIDHLAKDALIIENEIQHLFISIRNPKKSPITSEKWKTLDRDRTEYHNFIIKHYEFWYTYSHFLVQILYEEKEPEFRELHDGKMIDYTGPNSILDKTIVTTKVHTFYGISDLLQFNEEIRCQYDPQSLAQQILGLFSKQQGIVLALLEISLLLPYKKIPEKEIFESQMKEFQQPIININNTGIFNNEMILPIQSFYAACDFIENKIEDRVKQEELKTKVKEFQGLNNRQKYLEKYQQFVNILADHFTLLYPVVVFLMQQVPK
ncbi:hypothetical protein Mboo_1240 [Methanoregula boonei 6A8]|jgi:hypothetical protein|uniref:Uncharacterized protein n=1 Tax=Methanoregula boonei (strain DSM 21154 / JCM 14090 / 6A8) TaxID=456442 RepID=A7I7P7_METB6|nr:hypothetical protein [Methanoregula boonei]ABS55758.1 hypothetical protein Mboo_1240 [Methanoregula boonei 6A8]